MAKKSRTPPPPRKVQAPKRRAEPRRVGGDRLRRYGFAGLAAAVVVGVAVALGVVLTSGGTNDKGIAAAMQAAGCSFKTVASPPHKGDHSDVSKLTSKVEYNTFPPSNGAHYGAWAVWGFYTQPVNPRQVVHNEEHGGVVLWWGSKVPQSTIAKLHAFYSEDPVGMVGTPLADSNPGLTFPPHAAFDNKIAITAWSGDPLRYFRNGYYGFGHVAVCSTFNEKAFKTFRDEYRGKGPEGVPLASDQPGTGP